MVVSRSWQATTRRAFPNLTFTHPLLRARPPVSDRLFVGEQDGVLYSFVDRPVGLDQAGALRARKVLVFFLEADTMRWLYALILAGKILGHRSDV